MNMDTRPPVGYLGSLNDSLAKAAYYKALRSELKYQQKVKTFLDVDDVRKEKARIAQVVNAVGVKHFSKSLASDIAKSNDPGWIYDLLSSVCVDICRDIAQELK